VESALVLIGCLVLGESLIGERGLVAMMRAREAYRNEERLRDEARARNERLKEDVRLLRDDLPTIEDVARRELGLIKPGEKVFRVKDVPPASGR
jgi:cell division protein FtsB